MKIRDRIKELRRVPASRLRPHPNNWRTHPPAQQDALRGLLAEIGYADALVARDSFRMAADLLKLCGRELDVPADQLAGRVDDALEIALVLPFSGELQTFGESIYHGAIVAAEQYRRESGGRITLVPYDTKGEPVDAALIMFAPEPTPARINSKPVNPVDFCPSLYFLRLYIFVRLMVLHYRSLFFPHFYLLYFLNALSV